MSLLGEWTPLTYTPLPGPPSPPPTFPPPPPPPGGGGGAAAATLLGETDCTKEHSNRK